MVINSSNPTRDLEMREGVVIAVSEPVTPPAGAQWSPFCNVVVKTEKGICKATCDANKAIAVGEKVILQEGIKPDSHGVRRWFLF